MIVDFLTELCIKRVAGMWQLERPFLVRVEMEKGDELPLELERLRTEPLACPEGYRTDLASVPRAPIAFWLTGDTAHEESVPHDLLCEESKRYEGAARRRVRAFADALFLALMVKRGVPWWRRRAMHAAVRAYSLVGA